MSTSSSPSSSPPPPFTPPPSFECLDSFSLPGRVGLTLSLYRHIPSGLLLTLCPFPSPMTSLTVVLRTCSLTDYGEPHTLEHLVFMGSKLYPFKGVLDEVANRSFGCGTNAWTATDHTAYTCQTASFVAMKNVIPIYLDHIFRPLITPSSFITEVFHIDGKGMDGGVVYSEMVARENDEESICQRALSASLFPKENCYKMETGGMVKEIRKLNVEICRDFHKKYYVPNNCNFILFGDIDEKSLMDIFDSEQITSILSSFNNNNHNSNSNEVFHSPLQGPFTPFTKTSEQFVSFPSTDEEVGTVIVGWRSVPWSDFRLRSALNILGDYLCDTPIAPLQNDLVEIPNPFCSEIQFDTQIHNCSVHSFMLVEVPNEGKMMDKSVKALFESLKKVVKEADKFDISRLKSIISMEKKSILSDLETSEGAERIVRDGAISNFLYRKSPLEKKSSTVPPTDSLRFEMDDISILESLESEGVEFWIGLINKYFLSSPYSVVKGKPSKSLSDSMAKDEKKRSDQQIEKLTTENKLNFHKDSLDSALKVNEIRAPKELIEAFLIPKVENINKIHVNFINNNTKNNAIAASPPSWLPSSFPFDLLMGLPTFFHISSIPTDFIDISFYFNTQNVPLRLKSLLPLYRQLLFESPTARFSLDEVMRGLESDIIEYDSHQGVQGPSSSFSSGSFSQYLSMDFKFEGEEKSFQKGLNWILEVLFHLKLESERILIALSKLLSSIPPLKNDGEIIAKLISRSLNFSDDSIQGRVNFMRQEELLKEIKKITKSQKENPPIISELKELINILTRPENIKIQFIGDFEGNKNVNHQSQNDPKGISALKYFLESFAKSFDPSVLSSLSPSSVQANRSNSDVKFNSNNVSQWIKHSPQKSEEEKKSKNSNPFDDPKVTAPPSVLYESPSFESSYCYISAPMFDTHQSPSSSFSVSPFSHPLLLPLRVFCELLICAEGPFWKRIRGNGLAYGYDIRCDVEANIIQFSLYRASNLVLAMKESKEILQEYSVSLPTANEISAAKSSLVCEFVGLSDSFISSANQQFSDEMRFHNEEKQKNYVEHSMAQLEKITVEDIQQVVHIVEKLFNPNHSSISIAATNVKSNEIFTEMKMIWKNLKRDKNLKTAVGIHQNIEMEKWDEREKKKGQGEKEEEEDEEEDDEEDEGEDGEYDDGDDDEFDDEGDEMEDDEESVEETDRNKKKLKK